MYTSGPKKVAVFPPGFNPAAGGNGGLGAGLKQPINSGATSNAPKSGLGQPTAPMGGVFKQPMMGPPSTPPFGPKQPAAPLPKVGMPVQPKAPVKVPGFVPVQSSPGHGPPSIAPSQFAPSNSANPPPRYSCTSHSHVSFYFSASLALFCTFHLSTIQFCSILPLDWFF